jgi:hypothetical protein
MAYIPATSFVRPSRHLKILLSGCATPSLPWSRALNCVLDGARACLGPPYSRSDLEDRFVVIRIELADDLIYEFQWQALFHAIRFLG